MNIEVFKEEVEKLQENSNDSNTLIHSIRVGLNMKKDG